MGSKPALADQLALLLLGFPGVRGDGVGRSQYVGLWGPWGPVPLCNEIPFQPKLGDDSCHRFLLSPPVCLARISRKLSPG